jgi:hypothetical protein
MTIGFSQIRQVLFWKSCPIWRAPFRKRKAGAQPAFSSPMTAKDRAVIRTNVEQDCLFQKAG